MVFLPTSAIHPQVDYDYEGVHVHRFCTLEMPSLLFNGLTNGFNVWSLVHKIRRLGINFDDIVCVHGHTAMFAAYSLALKKINPAIISIVQHHDPDPFGVRNGRMAEWGSNARYKASTAMKLFKQMDLHLCISRYVENNLRSFPGHSSFDVDSKYLGILRKLKSFKPFTPKQTYVLYNGVDTDIFYPNPISHDKFTIGCIANIGDWKNQITLLRAVKILYDEGEKDLKLVLVGSGVGESECRQFIEDNSLEQIVEIRKEVHHKQLPAIFNAFDLFVLPSYFEGFGCVFTEAAACGIPFIGCKGQGATEYIGKDEYDEWTIKPFDYVDLAKKIQRYKRERTPQKLIHSYDINVLIKDYLKQLQY